MTLRCNRGMQVMTGLGHSRRFGRTSTISGLPPESRHEDRRSITSVWAKNGNGAAFLKLYCEWRA